MAYHKGREGESGGNQNLRSTFCSAVESFNGSLNFPTEPSFSQETWKKHTNTAMLDHIITQSFLASNGHFWKAYQGKASRGYDIQCKILFYCIKGKITQCWKMSHFELWIFWVYPRISLKLKAILLNFQSYQSYLGASRLALVVRHI